MSGGRRSDEDLLAHTALGLWGFEDRALGLTHRQTEVLQLLWQGHTNAAIASTLNISEHTVRHHLEDIYRQLGVSSRVAAAHVVTRALADGEDSLGAWGQAI